MGVLNLELKKGIWFARIVVPERLREQLGCRVMRRSLGTADKQAAISLKEPALIELRQRLLDVERAVEAGSVAVPGTPTSPFIPWLERRLATHRMREQTRRVEIARLEGQWRLRVAGGEPHETVAKAVVTFQNAATACIEARQAGWRRDRWSNPLTKHAFPKIGALPVGDITVEHVLSVLSPIWIETPVIALKVRSYIAQVLAYSKARKWRVGDNPAEWSDNLKHLLPATSQISEPEHHRSMLWEQIPEFMATLRSRNGTSFRALEFLILTAARSDEVLGMTWPEIDAEGRTWHVPSERMKEGRAHRVPLPDRTVAIIEAMRGKHPTLVFPSKSCRKMGHGIFRDTLKKRLGVDAAPHGFRSSFRDWCADNGKDRDLAEMALAHVIGSTAERAYRRSDVLERRRTLMAEWAGFCMGG
jgi:integrase